MEDSLPDLQDILGYDPNDPDDEPDLYSARIKEDREQASHPREEIDLTDLIEPDTELSPGPALSWDDEDDPEEIKEFDWDEDEEYEEVASKDPRISDFGSALPDDFDDDEDWNFEEDGEDEEEEDDDEEGSDYDSGNAFYYPDVEPRPDTPDEADEEEIEAAAPVTPPVKKAKEEKPEKPAKEGPGLLDKLKEKFAAFKEQAAAELQGEDAPKAKTPGKELALREDPEVEEKDEEEEAPKKPKKEGGGKNPLKAIFAPFWKLYLALVDVIFKVLEGTLGFLAKIPLLGIPFKFLKEFTKPLRIIATSLPLLLVVGLLVYLNLHAVDKETTTALPDNGSVTFSEFTYDEASKTAEGKITNTGEVIAVGKPVFTIYSMKIGLNPMSWFMPQERQVCEGSYVRVDIDKAMTVKAKCKEPVEGFQIRTSGEFK